MKKFLVTLIVIILAVSVGFGVFYLVRDNEVISLNTASLYKDAGESFEVSLDMEDPNSYTTVEVSSSDEAVLEVVDEVTIDRSKGLATGTFKALTGGNATITFKTNNAKFRNITCDVVVCDGSEEFPFRIDTAEELQKIGTEPYNASKSYTLNANIDLGALDKTFEPLPSFSGVFDGAGYTISNMIVRDSAAVSIGLFQEISATGVVKNIKMDGAVLEVNGSTETAGVVAGVNKGTIKLVEVISSSIKCPSSTVYVGGIAGKNLSTNKTTERQVARIDRCSANVEIGAEAESAKGYVGGITALNKGGVIINSYAKGNAYVADVELFGGLIARNEYLEITSNGTVGYNGDMGAKVKDCYSIVKINGIDASKMGHIIAENTDNSDKLNKVVGNYYLVREGDATLAGCGEEEIVYSTDSEGNKQYGTTAEEASSAGLKTIVARLSYVYKEKIPTISGNKVEIVEDPNATGIAHYWNKTIWAIDGTQNDGYPILTYVDEFVEDDFDNSTSGALIDGVEDLSFIVDDMSGAYYIKENTILDLSSQEWIPIGYDSTGRTAIPFSGALYMLEGSKITGLKITQKAYDYTGLFAILSSEAIIQNVVIENVELTAGGKNVGAIAGQNNGTVMECSVTNGTIIGKERVGALVGENKNIVADSTATSGENSLLTVKALESTNRTYVGGVAGLNSGNITSVDVNSNLKITSDSLSYLGGVAGYNTGVISRAQVNISRSTGYGVIASTAATAGGIAGYSTGTVQTSIVKGATISVSTTAENANAGGVVGELKAAKGQAINNVVVSNAYVSGFYAGGITARLNTEYSVSLNVSQGDWDFNGNVKVTNDINYDSDVTISVVAVESSVTLAGNTTGGMVVSMSKGMIADSYTKATLSGSNNAGIVWTISYNSSSKEGGVIYDSYSTATATGGNSYAVSSSQIHNTWNMAIGIGNKVEDRTVGVIFDYYYQDRDNMKNPESPNPFSSETRGRSESTLKKAGSWGFLNDSTWSISEGYLPTIQACETIKNW